MNHWRTMIIAGLAALTSSGALALTADESRAQEQARRFLDRLKVPMEQPAPSYKPLLAVSPEEVMKFMSPDGVVVWSAADLPDPETTFKPRTIESQLEARRGKFYSRLSHLGQTASIKSPQYSELGFRHEAADRMVVTLRYGYELTFVKRAGSFVLSRIKFNVKERE